MTAVMIVLLWLNGAMTANTVYFSTFAACKSALPAVEKQYHDFAPSISAVSAVCYEEARN